ncbi:MAG TPA: DNA mismatch repair endonuclease MutL, partial [Flavobacteriales bacterium]|nr:DNA mismatch repair endonuclease MutL [Flavobacteriales bacterium]
MPVQILSPDVANKIAAGEIVERPASVVKEIVENAIDARSTSISVDLRAGGKRLIKIWDNGIGMNREDALIAIERHATSKINNIEDLASIQTFGFRGEALPSIASVSKLELLTRTADQLEGTKITIEGGTVQSVEESGCSPGTHISVENLFHNVPARLKFLKTETTEINHITNQIMWAALAHTSIAFSLRHNDRSLLNVRVCESVIERVRLLYGKDLAESLIEIESEQPSFKMHAFIGNADLTKSNRNYQLFFLNRRPIRSKIISAALNEAMQSFITKGRYAVAFLFLTMDMEEVDVNVHPAKIEVRFRDERSIYSQIVRLLNSGIYRHKYIPTIDTAEQPTTNELQPKNAMNWNSPKQTQHQIDRRKMQRIDESSTMKPVASQIEEQTLEKVPPTEENIVSSNVALDPSRNQGEMVTELSRVEVQPSRQVIPDGTGLELLDMDCIELKTSLFNTYILAEGKDEVFIIDQHVASERVLYERYVTQFKEEDVPSQGLLLPVTIEAVQQQLTTFDRHMDLFKKIGFDI